MTHSADICPGKTHQHRSPEWPDLSRDKQYILPKYRSTETPHKFAINRIFSK